MEQGKESLGQAQLQRKGTNLMKLRLNVLEDFYTDNSSASKKTQPSFKLGTPRKRRDWGGGAVKKKIPPQPILLKEACLLSVKTWPVQAVL